MAEEEMMKVVTQAFFTYLLFCWQEDDCRFPHE